MTQVNNSIFPELQIAIDKNELMVVGQFLIIADLRDCSPESLEVFAQTFQLKERSLHCWLLENCEHKSLVNEF